MQTISHSNSFASFDILTNSTQSLRGPPSSFSSIIEAQQFPLPQVKFDIPSLPTRRQVSESEDGRKILNIDACIERLLAAGSASRRFGLTNICFKKSEIIYICKSVKAIFMRQPSLIEIHPPVKVMGDIHGQYNDLLRLFDLGGYPPASNYLLLGDYVDRGKQSLETILLLFCYKIRYPENFFLLRGNHECADVSRKYGFYDECVRRIDADVWKTFIDVFNTLPIAGLIGGKIFCVHGGISPSMHSMDDVRSIVRPTAIPEKGLLSDLLWSDPKEKTVVDWAVNTRGIGHYFGPKALEEFLEKFDLLLVCRSHTVTENGYKLFENQKLVTIFSAPAYRSCNNKGAIMTVDEKLRCSFKVLSPMIQNRFVAKKRVIYKHNSRPNSREYILRQEHFFFFKEKRKYSTYFITY
ncbi:MAG: Metallo-dependent phosphatase [Benjaminiella poitrasii]|nr:MAG: Metallo-dependent phosphatase [Benjaminiella poitrasii]